MTKDRLLDALSLALTGVMTHKVTVNRQGHYVLAATVALPDALDAVLPVIERFGGQKYLEGYYDALGDRDKNEAENV